MFKVLYSAQGVPAEENQSINQSELATVGVNTKRISSVPQSPKYDVYAGNCKNMKK